MQQPNPQVFPAPRAEGAHMSSQPLGPESPEERHLGQLARQVLCQCRVPFRCCPETLHWSTRELKPAVPDRYFAIQVPRGGSGSASPLSASNQATSSRTAAMSACISSEDGNHQAGRRQLPAATGQVRRLRSGIQYRAAAPGARHGLSRRVLQPLTTALPRSARA